MDELQKKPSNKTITKKTSWELILYCVAVVVALLFIISLALIQRLFPSQTALYTQQVVLRPSLSPRPTSDNSANVRNPFFLDQLPNIRALGNRALKIRYLSEYYLPNATYPNTDVITEDLARSASSSSTYANSRGELSPDGDYFAYQQYDASTPRSSEHGTYKILDLNKEATIFSQKNPAAPDEFYSEWTPSNQFLIVASMGRKIVIAPTTGLVLITIPHKDASHHTHFTKDFKYAVYAFSHDLISLDLYYPSIGIIKIDQNKANTLKIFPESNIKMRSDICWSGHILYYEEKTYNAPLGGAENVGTVDASTIYAYNADTGELVNACTSTPCNRTTIENTPSLCDKDPFKEDLQKDQEKVADLKARLKRLPINPCGDVLPVNASFDEKNNLIVFSCTVIMNPPKVTYSHDEDQVFVFDSTNNQLYLVGQGKAPRWVHDIR